MTSSQIRQSFLDFFKSKQHTIVPSSSLMPDSPNLLFTNAGMNQFVPIFLGQKKADVSKWAGAVPSLDTRAADTQKCIRAGGKHNDLEDVGLDTYHHTFFEMLGNWSFGDYFKKEAIDWAWELVTEVWRFPKERLYATVYSPDKSLGDPSDFDQEAYDLWAAKFSAAGLDPKVHIVNGNKKDNFWMMGDTGPCGPCSELHVDLTPQGDTKGALVNKGTAECIEIWNLVFIQFNANPGGTFSPLPAKHVDTGMGFERVTSIMQGSHGFKDFANAKISNYETDIFRPIFDAIEKLSGKRYGSTLPKSGSTGDTEQEKVDVAFRVIADHIRTLSFSIADGIQPGNTDRNYVLRRILRRAVKYGRTLGFHEPFFYKLVDVLAETMGQVFPEIRERKQHVKDVIRSEEEAFNKTLDRGIELFNQEIAHVKPGHQLQGPFAFKLYDTYGFPLDLTELMARERGLAVDVAGFNLLMDEQKKRSQAAQKKEVISLSQIETTVPTKFIGFDQLQAKTKVLEVVGLKDKTAVVLDTSSAYAEMGGQVGDTGELSQGGKLWRVENTQKSGNTWLHFLADGDAPQTGSEVELTVDRERRNAIQRHHTVTHILHWAIHEVVSREASQKGSFVGPDKLTFDFNSQPLTPQQVADVEKLVNERILENAGVSWTEVLHADVKGRKDVMQFFGDKYGDRVRVVQIGGKAGELNGYSMELCGGTHTQGTGEIGLFRIIGESAVAAGVRRIEAVAGLEAYGKATDEIQLIKSIAGKVNAPIGELEKKIDALLAQQKELERQLKAVNQKEAANTAKSLIGKAATLNGIPAIIENLGSADGDTLQSIADALKGQFKGVVVLGGAANGAVALVASVSPEFTAKVQAGKIIQGIAPIVGGKGGGKPDNARGGGKDVSKLDEAMAKAKGLIGA
ncbi:alanine--tRNA ligase [Pedosphaera parvula]|uniref:Alanine--tRNA ligase n=1 Tax=Pedosphaera parvula (strain Ellin514) TaxID=320771 RepID=B9XID2_PEDPL|nr:alanine--tRNA ligase [Pedosphaera parvula]EEF60393.1 alanyl-tRNA synthetase [Pedosphaera parvula Ellin514]